MGGIRGPPAYTKPSPHSGEGVARPSAPLRVNSAGAGEGGVSRRSETKPRYSSPGKKTVWRGGGMGSFPLRSCHRILFKTAALSWSAWVKSI